jgi:tetratricopeptide (TPR) repeat protein
LGNNARALQQPQVAQAYYQQAAEMNSQPIKGVEAQLNELSLLVETQQWPEAIGLLPTVQSNLDNLPISRLSIYARINFAHSLLKIAQAQPPLNQATLNDSVIDLNLVAQILAQAVQSAKILNDTRAESYALSQLGYLYEQANQSTDGRFV